MAGKTNSVVTNAPNVVAVVSPNADLKAALEIKAANDKKIAELVLANDVIMKANAEKILAVVTTLQTTAEVAIREFRSIASKEVFTAFRQRLFPRNKSGKARKPRTTKAMKAAAAAALVTTT